MPTPRLVADRMPPHSEEAERGLLGSAMLEDVRVLALATGQYGIGPDHFYIGAHQVLFATMLEMQAAERPIDLTLLGEWLQKNGRLEEVGGDVYLEGLLDGTPTSQHAEYYAEIVYEHHLLRGIISIAREACEKAWGNKTSDDGERMKAASIIADTDGALQELGGGLAREPSLKERYAGLIQDWKDIADKKKPPAGVPWPIPDVDEVFARIQPGVITVLAARPSQGKTTKAMQIVDHCLRADPPLPVGLVSLDMPPDQVIPRPLCAAAGVSMAKLMKGYVKSDGLQMSKLEEAVLVREDDPLHINDSAFTLPALCAWARAAKIRHHIGLLVIDHMHCMRTGDPRLDSHQVTMFTRISNGLKELARQLGIPVLVLCQLSRAGEGKPSLTALRETGAIEQDANAVYFLYKDEKNPGEDERHCTNAWLDCQKHQSGPTGARELYFDRPYFNFRAAPAGFVKQEPEEDGPDFPWSGDKEGEP